MEVTPYLVFDKQCAEAFRFYERALNGRIEMMLTWAESPLAETAPPEQRDSIMHATLKIGDRTIQGTDAPLRDYRKPQGFAVALRMETIEEAERVFAGLSEGATVQMPLQETFWSPRFGMLVDRFGTPWMINCVGQ